MRPKHRITTGVRRDNGIRVINSNMAETHVTIHGLGTVRDTGLAVEGRIARQRRHRERARRRAIAWSVIGVLAVSAAAFGWWNASERGAAATPLTGPAATASTAPGHTPPATMVGSSRPIVPACTPVFASYGSLKLHLPVSVADLTEVGFHQAAYTYALHMKTPLVEADNSDTRDAGGTGRETSTQPTGADAVLQGKFIRMWRNRPGSPDTAVDVGAKPGSDVYAPVSGKIVKIKAYKLYGKWDDYEIHIQPKGWPDLDLVMIHVTDLSATVGEDVVAGETRLASIRKLSDKVAHQLREYTGDGGDHTHIQLNNAKDPRYKGLEGALRL